MRNITACTENQLHGNSRRRLPVLQYGVFTSVCLSVCLFFRTISQKAIKIGSPNLTKKCSKISPGNSFILGAKRSKVKLTSQKTIPAWVFAPLWVLAFSGLLCATRTDAGTAFALGSR